jgi:hypothetical protein
MQKVGLRTDHHPAGRQAGRQAGSRQAGKTFAIEGAYRQAGIRMGVEKTGQILMLKTIYFDPFEFNENIFAVGGSQKTGYFSGFIMPILALHILFELILRMNPVLFHCTGFRITSQEYL